MNALAGRNDHVGGIEQISVDGTIQYFGFDYRSDLVLSPLTSSIDEIAVFASESMRQGDGARDREYWSEIAGFGSELCDDEADRTFELGELSEQMQKLKASSRTNEPAGDFSVPCHLQYLLASAGGWKMNLDDVQSRVESVNGLDGNHGNYRESANALISMFSSLVRNAGENWSSVFSVLDIA